MSRLVFLSSLSIALVLPACSGQKPGDGQNDSQNESVAIAEIANESEPAPTRDAVALEAMNRMSAALGRQTNFSVHSDLIAEDVLTSGQKVQYQGTADISARRPDKMLMTLNIHDNERQIFYDGKTFTISTPSSGYYASAAAPATIQAMLDMAQDRLGVQIPLADMFKWGVTPDAAASLTSAIDLGTETIGGNLCGHYAMRQKEADWQIWIREGENALPCKLVITMTSDPAMPQFSATYTWSETAPAAEAFTFQPPAGATKIGFAKIKSAQERIRN